MLTTQIHAKMVMNFQWKQLWHSHTEKATNISLLKHVRLNATVRCMIICIMYDIQDWNNCINFLTSQWANKIWFINISRKKQTLGPLGLSKIRFLNRTIEETELTNTFKVVCCLDISWTHLYKGDINLIQHLQNRHNIHIKSFQRNVSVRRITSAWNTGLISD